MSSLTLPTIASKEIVRFGEVVPDIGRMLQENDFATNLVQADIAHMLANGVIEQVAEEATLVVHEGVAETVRTSLIVYVENNSLLGEAS